MSAFDYVTALVSFVYALALTHLLARIAELIVVRESGSIGTKKSIDADRDSRLHLRHEI